MGAQFKAKLSPCGEALKKFGAPVERDKVTAETFTDKRVVYQIGIAPVRIDILTEITGVRFPEAWRKVANKQALGRSSDLEDLKRTRGSSTPTT